MGMDIKENIMTAFTKDPYSGLQLIELSHEWGHGVPSYPGQDDVKMFRGVKHGQHGVLAWKIGQAAARSCTDSDESFPALYRGKPLQKIDERKQKMSSKTVTVPNISCNHCTNTIETEVSELTGVSSVKANVDSKEVVVEWTDPANWDQIQSLMEEINFPPAN